MLNLSLSLFLLGIKLASAIIVISFYFLFLPSLPLVFSMAGCFDNDGRTEIRCVPPEIPKNSSVVYSGNDRSTSDSFIVGATVQYRCAAGHIVRGYGLRTCEANGSWSDSPPTCVCECCCSLFTYYHYYEKELSCPLSTSIHLIYIKDT